MIFPLGLWEISLWLAITAIILLVTSVTLSPYHGRINIYINKKRLKNAAQAVSITFLITVAVRIMNMLTY